MRVGSQSSASQTHVHWQLSARHPEVDSARPTSVIQQRGYRSPGELLQVVPGFTVSHRDLQLVTGVRGFEDNFDSWFTLDTDTLTIPRTSLVNRDTWAVGFFLDDEFQVLEWLKLVGGVRVDHNSILDGNARRAGGRAAWLPAEALHPRRARAQGPRSPGPPAT